MVSMSDLNELRPDWTNRRKLVMIIAGFLAGLLLTSLIMAVGLAYIAKFGLYISIFFVTFVVLCFITLLGIIGSYIFGASWEHKDFLSVIPDIVPDFHPNKKDDDDTPQP